MTLPNERTQAVNNARHFLRSLLDPKQTPRVPKEVRRNAYFVLKHFPSGFEMDRVSEKAPDIFGKDDE